MLHLMPLQQAFSSICYFWLDLSDVLDDNSLFKHPFILLLYRVWSPVGIIFGIVGTHKKPFFFLAGTFVLIWQPWHFAPGISLRFCLKRTRHGISGLVFLSNCLCWRNELKSQNLLCKVGFLLLPFPPKHIICLPAGVISEREVCCLPVEEVANSKPSEWMQWLKRTTRAGLSPCVQPAWGTSDSCSGQHVTGSSQLGIPQSQLICDQSSSMAGVWGCGAGKMLGCGPEGDYCTGKCPKNVSFLARS